MWLWVASYKENFGIYWHSSITNTAQVTKSWPLTSQLWCMYKQARSLVWLGIFPFSYFFLDEQNRFTQTRSSLVHKKGCLSGSLKKKEQARMCMTKWKRGLASRSMPLKMEHQKPEGTHITAVSTKLPEFLVAMQHRFMCTWIYFLQLTNHFFCQFT